MLLDIRVVVGIVGVGVDNMETTSQLEFTLGGKKVSLNRKMVELSVKGIAPDPIKKYWVQIGHQHYPIKQVVSVATGIPSVAFISTDAYRVLTRLGFDVKM
jgi:hypothetical protein